jgi:hypothetical protein
MSEREPFSQHVDGWFEPMIRFGAKPSDLKTQIVALTDRSLTPNRRSLEKVIGLLEQLPKRLRTKLVAQAKAVLNREYTGPKKTFRFTFSTHSPLSGQCSATSEFFSMLRQAITYND